MDLVVYGPVERASTVPAWRRSSSRPPASTPAVHSSSPKARSPGFAGRPPHHHRELHDMFYVLEGTLTLRRGDRTIKAGSGSLACVPPGVVHTFRDDGDGPVRLLNFNTPTGFENPTSPRLRIRDR